MTVDLLNPPKRRIDREDVLPMDAFAQQRAERRKDLVNIKKDRRVAVGPYCTFYFESYATMWWQIHEMLFIEKGGESQIEDELRAYNPLIPKGRELIATMMIEIEDESLRRHWLARLGHIETTITLEIDGELPSRAIPEDDVERTTADGKTSSVHFLHFPFADRQITAFRDLDRRAVLSVNHENYGHMAVLTPTVRAALAGDFL